MIVEVERPNGERAKAGATPIRTGIGVHYGEALVGNIGDARRLEYTVLGDPVSVASRHARRGLSRGKWRARSHTIVAVRSNL